MQQEPSPANPDGTTLVCYQLVASYLFPMLGINAAQAVVSIQLGYCASDIISKCGVGILIYQITYAKSNKEGLLP